MTETKVACPDCGVVQVIKLERLDEAECVVCGAQPTEQDQT